MAASLITLADARASLNLPTGAGTANDADLQKYIDAATPIVENVVGPMALGPRTYYRDGGKQGVEVGAYSSLVSVTVDGSAYEGAVTSSTGIVWAAGLGERFPEGHGNVVVTVIQGQNEIPENVKLATRELVRHLWQFGRQGNNRPALGGGSTAEPEQNVASFAVPNRVIGLLKPQTRLGDFA